MSGAGPYVTRYALAAAALACACDGAGGEPSAGGACCGCLCLDPTWSCSLETCLDEHGAAIALAPEAGFFELEGGDYVSEGQERTSPRHRVWYAFRPALTDPENKPLAVFFNGGPGTSTLVFFGFNTNRYTIDPARTGTAKIAENPHDFAALANVLYIDAPATGFSYTLPLASGRIPTVGVDLDRDAANFIRVVVRFLSRHPPLRDNPVILVGQSYGGARSALMLEKLLHYESLVSETAPYRDPELYEELVSHFSQVFPGADPESLTPSDVARQFGHQVAIQSVVAGSSQWDLNVPDTSPCVPNHDVYQCDEEGSWLAEQLDEAADRMTDLATLSQALGVDPTGIAWLYAKERVGAYGKSFGAAGDAAEMSAVFGSLSYDDEFYLRDNPSVRGGYDSDARFWTDPTLGASFLDSAFYVRTFMSDARLDMMVWTPAVPPALALYPELVQSSIRDVAPRAEVSRPGWILLEYAESYPGPRAREIRFPHYAAAGHAVTVRQPGELLADVTDWYSDAATPTGNAKPLRRAPPAFARGALHTPPLERRSLEP